MKGSPAGAERNPDEGRRSKAMLVDLSSSAAGKKTKGCRPETMLEKGHRAACLPKTNPADI